MFKRFAAAATTVGAVIGLGSIAVRFAPLDLSRFYPVVLLWCLLPLVWGVWAMFAPQSWVPGRLPSWGAILGAMVGIFGVFVLDMPARVLGISMPLAARAAALVVVALFYYLLWHLVRIAWLALGREP